MRYKGQQAKFWICDCNPPYSDLNEYSVKVCRICGHKKPKDIVIRKK